jgi:hypothetical protein
MAQRRKDLSGLNEKVLNRVTKMAEKVYDKTMTKKVEAMTLEQQVEGIRKFLRMPGVTIAVIRKSFLEDAGLPKDIKKYAGMGWTQEQIKDYFWGCEAFRKLWADMEMQEATLDELIRSSMLEAVHQP